MNESAVTMRAARINVNMTLKEAAEALNISKNTLIGYEKGRVIPTIDIALRMSNLYNRSVDDIIFLPSNCT